MMVDVMQRQADHVIGAPAQDAFGGLVDERGIAAGVEAVDTLAGGVEDQLVHVFQAFELPGAVVFVVAHSDCRMPLNSQIFVNHLTGICDSQIFVTSRKYLSR